MDLGAYVQIEDLSKIAQENGIQIPRLRGYRLMKNEEKFSPDKIKKMKQNCEVYVAESLCTSRPFWSPNSSCACFSSETRAISDYYLIKAKDSEYINYTGVRWDRIHGRKRKILKFEIKKEKRRIQRQYDMWNKYAGREDVLYIHSRMGGNNWKYYKDKIELMNQPWFLGRVDDYFDETYCDFYAKIDLTKGIEKQHET